MADILFIAITCAFIAVCLGYIVWCDQIIGPDDPDDAPGMTTAHTDGAHDVGDRADHQVGARR